MAELEFGGEASNLATALRIFTIKSRLLGWIKTYGIPSRVTVILNEYKSLRLFRNKQRGGGDVL